MANKRLFTGAVTKTPAVYPGKRQNIPAVDSMAPNKGKVVNTQIAPKEGRVNSMVTGAHGRGGKGAA